MLVWAAHPIILVIANRVKCSQMWTKEQIDHTLQVRGMVFLSSVSITVTLITPCTKFHHYDSASYYYEITLSVCHTNLCKRAVTIEK